MHSPKRYWEDYEIGEVVHGGRRELTETEVVLYRSFVGDWHCRRSESGRVVVPPMLAFSLGLCLLYESPHAWLAERFIAFYGYDEITIVDDVHVGDTLTSAVRVEELSPRGDDRGVVRLSHTASVGEAVASSSMHRILVARRSGVTR